MTIKIYSGLTATTTGVTSHQNSLSEPPCARERGSVSVLGALRMLEPGTPTLRSLLDVEVIVKRQDTSSEKVRLGMT